MPRERPLHARQRLDHPSDHFTSTARQKPTLPTNHVPAPPGLVQDPSKSRRSGEKHAASSTSLSTGLAVLTLVPPMDAEVERLLTQVNSLSELIDQAEAELLLIRQSKSRQTRRTCDTYVSELTVKKARPPPALVSTPRVGDHTATSHEMRPWDRPAVKQDCQSVDGAFVRIGRVMLKLETTHGQAIDSKVEHEYHSAILTQAIARGFLSRIRCRQCLFTLRKTRDSLFALVLHKARYEILRQRKMDRIVLSLIHI